MSDDAPHVVWIPTYRYKWVSLVLGDEPDTAAMAKAVKKGWEPVPADEVPDDLKIDQKGKLGLYRMDEKKAAFINQDVMDAHRKAEAFVAFEWMYHSHPIMPRFNESKSASELTKK